jgi:hypothetical protein
LRLGHRGVTAIRRILRLSALVVAVASAFAGAVTAVLPALVVGLVARAGEFAT